MVSNFRELSSKRKERKKYCVQWRVPALPAINFLFVRLSSIILIHYSIWFFFVSWKMAIHNWNLGQYFRVIFCCFPTTKESVTCSHGRWHYTCENTLEIILGIAVMMIKPFSLDSEQNISGNIIELCFLLQPERWQPRQVAIKSNGKTSFKLNSVVVVFTPLLIPEKEVTYSTLQET